MFPALLLWTTGLATVDKFDCDNAVSIGLLSENVRFSVECVEMKFFVVVG